MLQLKWESFFFHRQCFLVRCCWMHDVWHALPAWEIRGENCREQQVRAASPDHQGGMVPQLHGSRLFGRAVCREYASDIMLSHVCLWTQNTHILLWLGDKHDVYSVNDRSLWKCVFTGQFISMHLMHKQDEWQFVTWLTYNRVSHHCKMMRWIEKVNAVEREQNGRGGVMKLHEVMHSVKMRGWEMDYLAWIENCRFDILPSVVMSKRQMKQEEGKWRII